MTQTPTPNNMQEESWWDDGTFKGDLKEEVAYLVHEAERRTWEEMKQMCLDTCINFEEMGEFMKNWPWNSCANSLINKIDAKLKSLS